MAFPRARASVLILGLLLVAPALAAAAEEQAPIGATIQINQSAATASLYGASSDVRVSVYATVHISTEHLHRVTLTFSVAQSAWAFELSPETFSTTTSTDVPVTATVIVPRSAAEGVYNLALSAVDGNAVFPINAEAPFTVSVFRGPLAIFAVGGGAVQKPGENASWELTLRNFGTADLDFDVAVTVPLGFSSTVVNPPVQIVEGHNNQTVSVTVRAPASAVAGDYTWSVSITSTAQPSASTSITVPFQVAAITPAPAPAKSDFLAQYWLPITFGMFAVGVVAYIGLTEVGYLALAFTLLVPLFTRIRHEKVLDNFTRGQIFGHIQANPGAHYSAIQQMLDIDNGVLAYHLRVLMREEFIVARNEGVYKRFYPRDYKIPKGRTLLTRLQVDILEAVERAPGISQRDVAQALGESKQVISYNVGVLRDAGLISAERRGRDVVLRAPGVPPSPFDDGAAPATPSDLTPQ